MLNVTSRSLVQAVDCGEAAASCLLRVCTGGGATESLDTTAQSQSCHTPTTANTPASVTSVLCRLSFVKIKYL